MGAMRTFPILLTAVFVVVCCCTPSSRAAVVRTLDGKTLEGELRLDNGRLTIAPKNAPGGQGIPIDLANVLELRTKSPTAPPSGGGTGTVRPPAAGPTAGVWTSADVGTVKTLGRTEVDATTLRVEGAGIDIGYKDQPTVDHFRFVHQPLRGDGEIVARLTSFTQDGRSARVGIMFRDRLEPNAPNAMLFCMGSNVGFQGRLTTGGETVAVPKSLQPVKLPVYLKVVRSGITLTAFISKDAKEWKQIGSQRVALPNEPLVGIAVTSRQPDKLCTAVFEEVTLGASNPAAVAAVGSAAEPSASLLPIAEPPPTIHRGLVLRNGSQLSCEVRSIDDTAAKFRWSDKDYSLAGTAVAQLITRPLTPAFAEKLAAAGTGVLLHTGDFMDGSIAGYADNRLKLSTVLFGLRTFDVNDKVTAATFRKPAATGAGNGAAYQVRMQDGSLLLGKSISVEKDRLIVEDEVLGPVSVNLWQVFELSAGAGRFTPLTALRAEKVEGATGGNRVPLAVVPAPTPQRPDRKVVALTAGGSASYNLAGAYRTFVCDVSQPDTVLPLSRIRLVILADGKELLRTPERSSLDAPLPLSVQVANVKTLTLRIETADPIELPPTAILGEAALIK